MTDHLTHITSKKTIFALPPALKYPAYRDYWMGTLASVSGFQIFQFGQIWLVHELTHSPLFLGYLGLANAVPAIALNLFGGVFADMFDKRQLIRYCQLVTASLILLLAIMTTMDAVHVYYVLIIAFLGGAVNAFDQPARQALYPHLVDRSVMLSAVALNSAIWQGTRIIAPALAGITIATLGTHNAFFIAAAGFLTMALVISILDIPDIERGGTGNPLLDMKEGVEFIARNSIFSFLMGMAFFNSLFGMSYIFIMPVFAVDILRVGPDGQGMLLAASGLGAVVTTMLLGSMRGTSGRGPMMIGGAVGFGLSLILFAMTSEFHGSFTLALSFMFVLGVAHSIYMISVMSTLQVMVPNRMRGRVMGFFGMTWSFMPLGGMWTGSVANYVGAPSAVSIGGLAIIAFAVGPAALNSKVRNLGNILGSFQEESRDNSSIQSTSTIKKV